MLAGHPRYRALVRMHGEAVLPPRGGAKAGTSTLGGSLVKVTIRSFDAKTCTVPPAKKRLPLSMKVSALKLLCKRVFKVKPAAQRLFFRSPGSDMGHPTPLDDDRRTLFHFGVCDGGEVILESVDEAAAARKAARDEEARKAELERQMQHAANMTKVMQQQVSQGAAGAAAGAGN